MSSPEVALAFVTGIGVGTGAKIAEETIEALKGLASEAKEQVPSERQQEPKKALAGPVLDEAKYYVGASEGESEVVGVLRDMFRELLSRTMDEEREDEVHPSFAKILGQLSRDEAEIIRCLHEISGRRRLTGDDLIIQKWWSRESTLGGEIDDFTDWESGKVIVRGDKEERLRIPDRIEMYADHLESLRVIKFKNIEFGMGQVIEKAGETKEVPRSKKGTARLSALGRRLAKACVPDDETT